MIDKLKIIEVWTDYRLRLKAQGKLMQAVAVERCMVIVWDYGLEEGYSRPATCSGVSR